MRREEAQPDMEERDYRRVERERRRSSLAKGKDRRSSKAGKKEERGKLDRQIQRYTEAKVCERCEKYNQGHTERDIDR